MRTNRQHYAISTACFTVVFDDDGMIYMIQMLNQELAAYKVATIVQEGVPAQSKTTLSSGGYRNAFPRGRKLPSLMMAITLLLQLQSVALVLQFNRATAALGSSEVTKFSCDGSTYPVSHLNPFQGASLDADCGGDIPAFTPDIIQPQPASKQAKNNIMVS